MLKLKFDLSEKPYNINHVKSHDIPEKERKKLIEVCCKVAAAAKFNVTREDIESHLFEKDFYLSLLQKGKKTLGFAVFDDLKLDDKKILFLHGIVLHPATHGKGFGKKILQEKIQQHNPDCVALRTHNPTMFMTAAALTKNIKNVSPNFVTPVKTEILDLTKKIDYFGENCNNNLVVKNAYPIEMLQQKIMPKGKADKYTKTVQQNFGPNKLGKFDARAVVIEMDK